MQKRNPLSTAETVERSTSPRRKPWETCQPRAGFTGGLVGLFLGGFNVPQVDTFIEKPFCTLNLRGLNLLIPSTSTRTRYTS